jgi:ankyrin repeat protein
VLHIAARCGNEAIDRRGRTALHIATADGHAALVRLLLNRGGRQGEVKARCLDGAVALMLKMAAKFRPTNRLGQQYILNASYSLLLYCS